MVRDSQVDKDIWKTFGDEEYHGKVAYAHVLVSGGEVLYHVVSLKGSSGLRARLRRVTLALTFLAENNHAGHASKHDDAVLQTNY